MAANCLGLDIGSSSIKILQVESSKRGIRLVNFGIEPLPPQAIVDGSIMDQSAIVEAIGRLRSALGIKLKNVATAISGHSVIIKKVQVPQMSREELDEQIPYEAEHHIPFRKDEVEIDHQLVTARNGQGQMEVMLVAAKKEVIADYAQVIRDAKLIPSVMDVAAFTMQNAFEVNYDVPPEESVALVNVGAAISNINVLSQGNSVFTRDVTIGGAAYTEEIQKRLNISQDEAEALKLAASDATVPRRPEVEAVLNEVSDGMVGKLQRSLDFYLAASANAVLSRIYLCGGSAKVESLGRMLQDRSRIPVEILDPFRRLTIDERRFDLDFIRAHASEATVGIGLALRRPGDHA